MTIQIEEIVQGLYLLNPEVTIQPSEQVDIGVHLFFNEFREGVKIEPYTSNVVEHLRNSRYPIITAVPKGDWDSNIDKLLSIEMEGNQPLILYKSNNWGPFPIELGVPFSWFEPTESFVPLADFIREQFNPERLVIYGSYLLDIHDSPERCVGCTYKYFKEHYFRKEFGGRIVVEIDRDLVL